MEPNVHERFPKERKDFPTAVHREIHIAALQLTPPERSLSGMTDPVLRESCLDYYAFVCDMLADMYADPDNWGQQPGALEAFLYGRKPNQAKRHEPAKVDAQRSIVFSAVPSYQNLLRRLGEAGVCNREGLLVPSEAYQTVRKRHDASLSKGKTNDNRIPYEQRWQALGRVGLSLQALPDGGAQLRCQTHPGMFLALSALAKSAPNTKTGGVGFQQCEFRQIASSYQPGYQDVVQPLDDAMRARADALHQALRAHKCSASCTTYWKVNYKYRNEQVCCIGTNGNALEVRVNGCYGWDDPEIVNKRLRDFEPAFQRYVLRHLQYCTGCSGSHLGCFTTVLEKKKRVCGGGSIGFRVYDPDDVDIACFLRLLELRRAVIDENRMRKKNAV